MDVNRKKIWSGVPFAVMFCAGILLICMIPAVARAIIRFDEFLFLKLNALITKSFVFDHALRFIIDPDYSTIFALAFAAIVLLCMAFSADPRERIRRFSILIFIGIVLAITMIAEDQFDKRIERRSPSYSELPFKNIAEIYKWEDFDFTDKKTFPSDEGLTLFTVGFLLLRFHFRRLGSVFTGLGFVMPLGLCMAGVTWVSDIYLGAFPAALLASAVATQTRFRNLLPWIEQQLTLLTDQVRMTTFNLRNRLSLRTRLLNYNDAILVENAIKRFVRVKLPRILEQSPPDTRSKTVIIVPADGVRNLVRILEHGDNKVVLRVYPSHKLRDARRHKKAADVLQGHGISTPKILSYIEYSQLYENCSFILEEFVEGHFPRSHEFTDAQIDSLAETLARLHSVHAKDWGSFEINRYEDCFSVYYRRAKRYLKNSHLTSQQKYYIKQWLRAYRGAINNVSQFSLVHRDLRRGNGFFTADNHFCLLDNVTVQWGIPAGDIAMVYYYYFENDSDMIAQFEERYFPRLSAEYAETQKNLLPFYLMVQYLMELSRNSKSLNTKRKKKGSAKGEAKQTALLKNIDVLLAKNRLGS